MNSDELASAITGLSTLIGEWATDKGFRDDWHDAEYLEALADSFGTGQVLVNMNGMVQSLRRIAKQHRMLVISSKIALMHSELSEMHEALRDGGAERLLEDTNYGEELADTIIRLLENAHMVKSNVGEEIMQKVVKNNSRPRMHGRQL